MALLKTAVFVASRFGEFAELREALKRKIADYPVVQFTPIDLNNGNVSFRPPIAECLGYVRRSEFMILLLGETYGTLAPGFDKSFTHLEYEEAIREGSSTRVLVFCIGDSYRGGRITPSSDSRLATWQKQVEANHTLGHIPPDMPVEEMSKLIFERLLAALYEMRFGVLSVDASGDLPDEIFDAISEDAAVDDTEVSSLEEREAQARGLSLADESARFANVLDAVRQPAAVAALEQREEAQRAINIRQYGAAIQHLRRALELKPLDLMSNYWLAQIYVSLGRKERFSDAVELAERAARIAEHDGSEIRAAACYMIAARAAQLGGESDDALQYARQAVATAPRYARAYVELGRQHACLGQHPDALKAIKQAFTLFPRSLREVFGDPLFKPIRKGIDALIHEVREKVGADVRQLIDTETRLAELAGSTTPVTQVAAMNLQKLIEAGRKSVYRQYEDVCELMSLVRRKEEELADREITQPETTVERLPNLEQSGSAKIVTWMKKPGDIIQPGDVICTIRFGRSSTTRPWAWRSRAAVRMMSRAGDDGVTILASNPVYFEHVPATVELPQPSLGHILRVELARTRGLAEDRTAERKAAEYKLTDARSRRAEHNINLRMLIAGAVALAAVMMFIVGNTAVGILLSVFLVFVARVLHSQYREVIETLARAEESHGEAAEAETKVLEQLNALEKELSVRQQDLEEHRRRAKEALQYFEGSSLRKGARLVPFPNIYRCDKGNVVRVRQGQIQELMSRYGRNVEIADGAPSWSEQEQGRKDAPCLYRVLEVSPERLVLSRAHAYISHQVADASGS
jgi:tetratricopeptide (TPR) repeat protein